MLPPPFTPLAAKSPRPRRCAVCVASTPGLVALIDGLRDLRSVGTSRSFRRPPMHRMAPGGGTKDANLRNPSSHPTQNPAGRVCSLSCCPFLGLFERGNHKESRGPFEGLPCGQPKSCWKSEYWFASRVGLEVWSPIRPMNTAIGAITSGSLVGMLLSPTNWRFGLDWFGFDVVWFGCVL